MVVESHFDVQLKSKLNNYLRKGEINDFHRACCDPEDLLHQIFQDMFSCESPFTEINDEIKSAINSGLLLLLSIITPRLATVLNMYFA